MPHPNRSVAQQARVARHGGTSGDQHSGKFPVSTAHRVVKRRDPPNRVVYLFLSQQVWICLQ
jgi:hypothetical protein